LVGSRLKLLKRKRSNRNIRTNLFQSFPDLNDDSFTYIFGERNGTRQRILCHLQGGSFDIGTIRGTIDMRTKEPPIYGSHNLFIIESLCATSYKLTEDGINVFHSIRLYMNLIVKESFFYILQNPFTSCACPFGWNWCVHEIGFF
jgi:hypothetical protein